MSKRYLALIAAFLATSIYGINHTLAKEIMPIYIGSSGFIMLRLLGATLIFWLISLFTPYEKIEKRDFLKIIFAAVLGMCINMLAFFRGLELSTPINSGVIITLSPILVLILSYFFLKEKVTLKKILGIIIGFSGAIFLILNTSKTGMNAPNIPLGNSFFLLNASAYAGYLIVVKPLTSKYNIFTIMKWLFLIGLILSAPITYNQFVEVNWLELPWFAIWRMAYVVIGTTFLTYLFNIYALKTLSPTTVGSFIYLQPIITIVFALITANDTLDSIKLLSCLIIFIGVYLVSVKNRNN
ncbi:MAG: DMT family transporter [Cryomorphaceae bacterium]|jgi:drug/metabolite transporter (DMT)-like permease|nr:DMT family transporter [Cryomorphaceae bacterium]MBT4293819.1 DMT family transporter [Cryomorphaceae bacterium]MBT4834857.1 DMT family transporter [Cryomorphaceae bacterium]MBT5936243.1 DMT family transporter [Cryomorphaceae bacterium]MBT6214231.1 DMT family transporter [Cryomorphaceae bacterium]